LITITLPDGSTRDVAQARWCGTLPLGEPAAKRRQEGVGGDGLWPDGRFVPYPLIAARIAQARPARRRRRARALSPFDRRTFAARQVTQPVPRRSVRIVRPPDEGFFYDYRRAEAVSSHRDLEKIEAKMR
jgi:hypothetical protein